MNDEDDEACDCDEAELTLIPRKWDWIVLGGFTAHALSRVFSAVSDLFDHIDTMVGCHLAAKDSDVEAHRALQADLEKL